MKDEELKLAHKHSSKHRAEIESSANCGCFYCGKMFSPAEITDWLENGQTAQCPKCGIDSVLGSSSGLLISRELLDEMNNYWF
jgi:NAD-dependent SIR2 family protein deacetylase